MKSIRTRVATPALLSALAAIALPAFAAPMLPAFKNADRDRDGTVSLREFEALGGAAQAFHAGDTNRDARLGSDEYAKAVANNDRLKAANYADDAWITAKVKALLLKDDGVKGLDVNVETHEGTVQLSGWVSNPAQLAQAEKIARGVEGVKDVRNDLQLTR